ncbi:sigma factor-like helix-turn-helix DNA-binding protein, partial [Acinetobacter baumannii]
VEQIAAAPTPVDARIDLTNGLARLTPEHRQSIVAVGVEGWTHEEAGGRAGLPTPTCKARVQRGLKRMRHFQDRQLPP